MSTEKRAFSVSWASWNRQKCPEIVLKFSKNLVVKFHFLLLGALSLLSQWKWIHWKLHHHCMCILNNILQVILMAVIFVFQYSIVERTTDSVCTKLS